MRRETRFTVIHTRQSEKKLTLENFEKKPQSGVFYLRCPQTGKEILFSWEGIKERNEIREIRKEINEEYKLKMVS